MSEKLIRPTTEKTFFIGWSPDVPAVDRRAMLLAAAGLTVLGAGAGAWLASQQRDPGAGTWNQAYIRDFTGAIYAEPYPLIRTRDIDGEVRTALLACMTKCGVRDRLAEVASLGDGAATVRGSLIERGRHAMITVVDGEDWIAPAEATRDAVYIPPAPRKLGQATLRGEVLDAKCWYGAMRPGEGKVHKACAALCIRSGLPPAFYARDPDGGEHALLLTDMEGGGIAPTEEFLALVADPSEATGEIVALGDRLELRVAPGAIRRV
jgi:hypothetical protein